MSKTNQDSLVENGAAIQPDLDDAVKIILSQVKPLEAKDKLLPASVGLTAAENVYADMDLPQTDIAGRDGYAVRSQDIGEAAQDRPALLRITAAARAGRPTRRVVQPGSAIRIMTGSMMPRGADCVVQFEDTDEPKDKNGLAGITPPAVKIFAAMPPGANIWPAGNHIRKGSILLRKGALIGPAQISALASIGKTRISVIRQPKVAIIATGDELVWPGGKLTCGKIYSGNSTAIAALVRHYGGIPQILGIARDTEASLLAKIQKGMTADAIITIGGVSKGDYDLVRPVMAKIGKVLFSGIRMMPGTATAFSLVKQLYAGNEQRAIPVFSLSGPPAACLINFETMVRPALLSMSGRPAAAHPSVEAVVQDAIWNQRSMTLAMFTSLQSTNSENHVRFNITQNRSIQSSLAAANSLTILPRGVNIKPGDRIRVWLLDWNSDSINYL